LSPPPLALGFDAYDTPSHNETLSAVETAIELTAGRVSAH
jgi:hypothetical protein